MTDLTDSIIMMKDDELTRFLSKFLELAEERHAKADRAFDEGSEDSDAVAYYQGQKDAIRIVIAQYLNWDELATHNRSSPFHIMRRNKGHEHL